MLGEGDEGVREERERVKEPCDVKGKGKGNGKRGGVGRVM